MTGQSTPQRKHTWTWTNNLSTGWGCRFRFGRLQVGGTIIRHRYGGSISDRWVVQPEVIYDRA